MAKKKNLNIVGVKASTIAMFEGTFASIIGLTVAILYSMQTTLELTESTNSVLKGLAFGVATGVVSLIVIPLVYFGIGWVIGYLHAWVFNVVIASSGGIVVDVEE